MGLRHMLLGLAFDQMVGDFEVQAQRGEVVAEQVVQLAGDAGALVDAHAFGEQGAGGAQLGIQPSLLLAGLRLLAGDQAGRVHEPGKPGVEQRLHDRFVPGQPEIRCPRRPAP